MSTYKLVTEHTDGTHVQTFMDADEAVRAGQATSPELDGSMMPNLSDEAIAEFGGDRTYYSGMFWLGNRYAAIFTMEADYTVF